VLVEAEVPRTVKGSWFPPLLRVAGAAGTLELLLQRVPWHAVAAVALLLHLGVFRNRADVAEPSAFARVDADGDGGISGQ
jgi:hypothetical protein